MAKKSPGYRCAACEQTAIKWSGRCPACNEWNTLYETEEPAPSGPQAAGPPVAAAPVTRLRDARLPEFERISTGFVEFDNVLGGGLVPGGVVLLGGDPGIGKSTLLLQAAATLISHGSTVLYVAGEESPAQIALRSRRLRAIAKELLLTTECCVEAVVALLDEQRPDALIVDSIQTVWSQTSTATPGSLQQLRASTAVLTAAAKRLDIPTILVGHVTRSGSIAGPRAVEHLVDSVLYLEGDPGTSLRIVRGVKNRFGSTLEVGILEMGAEGMRDAPASLTEIPAVTGQRPPGVCITSLTEGTRAFNVEIQALVTPAAYGAPRIHCVGVDNSRVQMIAAIVERHVGDSIAGADMYVNVSGGFRIQDPAADLALAAAITSSLRNRPMHGSIWATGELSLTGEVRPVMQLPARLAVAARAGYTHAVVPAATEGAEPLKTELVALRVRKIQDALDQLLRSD